MTRDDDPGRAGPVASQPGADELDPLLVRAFSAAFDRNLPVDVEARHLWQLYRSARPSVIDGLAAAPDPGRLQRMLARVAITVVVTLMPSVLTAASADALPGDVLYGVKRHHQLEQVELAVSWTERDAALVQLAELRLDEARAVVVSRPRAAARVVADAAAALEELERSPLSTGSLQARRMRDAAAREVAALLDDVPDPDRRHLEVAYEELSDDGPRIASAPAPLGADEQRLATLRRTQSREPSAADAVRSAAPGTPSPAADDRQLLARAPDDAPDAVSTQPTATPPPSRPSTAPAAVAAAAPRPADPVPAATAPTPQQPAVVEPETEDPPPPTDEPASEPDTTPTVAPEPSSEPSDAENAGRPPWALPRSPSPSATVDPEPTPAPSPESPPEPSTEPSSEPSTEPSIEPSTAPAPTTSPSISAEPTASPSATSSPRPSERPATAALRPQKGAAKAWKPGVAGRGSLAASVAPAAPEAP